MASNLLTELERNWMAKKITGNPAITPQTPLGEIKRRYYSQYLGGDNSSRTFAELQSLWLDKYIRALGGTPDSKYDTDMWRQLVSLTGQTASRYLNDNKILFYRNVA